MIGINPSSVGMSGRYDLGSYPNPAYDVSSQFLPRNFHDLLKWTRFILVKSPTIAEVIRKLSTYPITEITIESSKEDLKDKYKDIFDSIKLIEKMCDAGFDYHVYGNSFSSFYFPIDRFLECPKCKTSYDVHSALTKKYAVWKRFTFQGECPGCSERVDYKRIDSKSRDIKRINLIKWKPDNISLNNNPITGEVEYYYKLPSDTKKKILAGDPHFISTIPWEFVEAVRLQRDFRFSDNSIYHMKSLSMGDFIEGYGVPPLLSHYSTVFYTQCLKRANEAIALEHMNPMRMVFPQASGSVDPITAMQSSSFTGNVKQQLRNFKNDPNHVLIAPHPIGVGYLGGQGKSLLVTQEIQEAEQQSLLALGVSRELLSGTSNWSSSTVGLRLLENNMNQYVRKIDSFLQWAISQVSAYLNLEDVEVDLVPFELTDNDNNKQFLIQMNQMGLLSNRTLHEAFDLDPEQEAERIRKAPVAEAESALKTKREIALAAYMANKDIISDSDDESGFDAYREDITNTAKKVLNITDEKTRTEFLIDLQHTDEAKFNSVMDILREHMSPPDEEEENASKQPV